MHFFIFFTLNVIKIIKYAILVRVLLSWIQTDRAGRFTQFIYDLTEPLLRICRNILPRTGMIDLSPIIALLLLEAIEWLIMSGLS